MSSERDPIPLTDPRSGAPPELLEAIRGLQNQDLSAEALTLEHKLIAGLRAKQASVTPPAAEPLAATAGGAPLVSALALLLLAGLAFVPASSKPRPSAVGGRSVLLVQPAPPAEASPIAEPALTPLVAEPIGPAPGKSHRHRVRRAPRLAAPEPALAPPPPLDPEAELALLQRSRAALRENPTLALELAEQHQHDYPNGIFSEEREILALEALLRLHRSGARLRAFERARRFLARHPSSTYAFRVRELVEQWAGPFEAQSAGDSEATER